MNSYKNDFPILREREDGKRIIYLDSAATAQKPQCVIDVVNEYYSDHNANPHRGAYGISIESTDIYDESRRAVKKFLNVKRGEGEVVFTKNATEAFNLLAYSYGMEFLKPGDEILISISEHHSNLVPWQNVAKKTGATVKYIYLEEGGKVSLTDLKSKLTTNTKIVAFTHVSNVLGVENNIKEIIKEARSVGAVTIIDGTQAVPHIKVDLQDIDSDFYIFSGHKLMAPMGVGVLYGKVKHLEKMPPFMFGGDMVEYVTEENTTYAEVPAKFEGGTQNVEAVAGLKVAIDYLSNIGMENIRAHEEELTRYALEKLKDLPYVKVYGEDQNKLGVIAFNIDGVHPHDVASIFDSHGVCIRAGNHCAQPLMNYLKVNSTCRASFYVYNDKEDVDSFIEAIKSVRKVFRYE